MFKMAYWIDVMSWNSLALIYCAVLTNFEQVVYDDRDENPE